MSFQIRASKSVNKEIHRIIDGQFDGMDVQLALMELDPQDSIHELRKHIKRLRSLLKLLNPLLNKKRLRRQNNILRGVARSFRSHRDSDALSETLDRLNTRLQVIFTETELAIIRSRLAETKSQSTSALIKLTGSASDNTTLCRKGCEKLSFHVSRKKLNSLFLKSYIKSQRRFHIVNKTAKSDDFHNWRKSVKDLYYQSQLLKKSGVKLPKSYLKDLHLLGETLGEYQDISMLIEKLGSAPELLTDLADNEMVLQELWIARESIGKRAQVMALVLLARKPKKFRKLYLSC